MPRVDNQDTRSGGAKKKRPSNRTLIRWDDDKDKQVLLMLQYVCNNEGIRIPWDKVATGLGPDYSEGAIVQHLAKLRARMAEMGLGVPPPLKRGVLQTPSKVYSLGSRNLRGLPRLITPPLPKSSPTNTTAGKKTTARTKARKAKDIYDDTSMDEVSDDAPKERKPTTKGGQKDQGTSERATSVEVKQEDAPRRSSARTAGVRKDYSKMVDGESEEEEFEELSEQNDSEAEFAQAETVEGLVEEPTEESFEEPMEESFEEPMEDTMEPSDSDDGQEANEDGVKSERNDSQTLSPGTGTRPTKIVKLSFPKTLPPVTSNNVTDQGNTNFTGLPPTFNSPLLTTPYTLSRGAPDMSFSLGTTEFPGAMTYFDHHYGLGAPVDVSMSRHQGYFNFGGGNQFGNFVTSPPDETGALHGTYGMAVHANVSPRVYGSFSTDATTPSLDPAVAPSNNGDDGLLGNEPHVNANGLPEFDEDEYKNLINVDSTADDTSLGMV